MRSSCTLSQCVLVAAAWILVCGCGKDDSAARPTGKWQAANPPATASTTGRRQGDQGIATPDASADLSGNVPEPSQASFSDHMNLARANYRVGRLAAAERELRAALRQRPEDPFAHRGMADVLNAVGRRWEAEQHILTAVRHRRFTIKDLVLLGNRDEPFENSKLIDAALRLEPESAAPLICRARIHSWLNQEDEAQRLLLQVVERSPELSEAQAQLALILLRKGAHSKQLMKWHRNLPTEAERHPGIWFVRGLWAEQLGEKRAAARCFWEAIQRDPNHRRACYHLGLLLNGMGERDHALPFAQRAAKLGELEQMVHPIFTEGPTASSLQGAAELCVALGRIWEAWAWYGAMLSSRVGDQAHAARQQERLMEVLQRDQPPQVLPAANPTAVVDLASYPTPGFDLVPEETAADPTNRTATVKFANIAVDVGIDFVYFDSATTNKRPGRMIFETTGGGVAVLDYDGDSWPDLYFTQCCEWPPRENSTSRTDRLFRNLGNGQFMDVTDAARLGDAGYSQGVSVGDIDNDGWPDLYVANIGGNRLYRNNGDGTFTDVTGPSRLTAKRWTTSCVVADLNGDSLPDLYDVNYLAGKRVFDTACGDRRRHVCRPGNFRPARDQLFINLGNGRWQDVSQQSGVQAAHGNGLGIIAADFDQSGKLSLFVANDEVANFFYVNETASPGSVPRLVDEALLSGLALNRDGVAQACMGVAFGDADGNGLFDLFVTNYYNDGNTMYLQDTNGLFSDLTRQCQLYNSSFRLLGFGTQFLDADLDGKLDLVVANGHVDDFSDRGAPFRMRPQFFHAQSTSRYVELDLSADSPYFRGTYLGRGLARIDWNRDGREDFVVSHIGAPASLVSNESQAVGHYFVLRLRGVQCARDAIGTTVTLVTTKGRLVHQLTAGDGYQASNQRQLVFGLGSHDEVEKLTVRWPTGDRQTFLKLPGNGEYLLVQGRDRLFELPR